ncbi:Nramp family divalent metal transporter [Parvularcula marina]|uniref:Nramp family divalent metal transporter n=1 Tax=Parvularcula marina TaxID=2292771 RepID=UPI0035192AA6
MKLRIGPGALVAAAFIGPGTVTTCTLAGANFGFALVWALVFATLATILLQDMAARLGAGAKRGLGEALMETLPAGPVRIGAAVLVFLAIAVGNAAYEAGNLAGGALGLGAILGEGAHSQKWAVAGLSLLAGALLLLGKYKTLEKVLIGLVILMSLAFAATAVMVRPDLGAFAGGLVPRVPEGGLLTAIALIGTTIVPYNLFLHAAAAKRRWPDGDASAARSDTVLSVGLGGIVSILIVSVAAGAAFSAGLEIANAADMARSLEPLAGTWARYLLGAGLLAAGLTSAITAPLAAGYALSEMVPNVSDAGRARLLKATALVILGIGMTVGLLGIRPVTLILVAQAANGLLLPIIAGFLLYVMNRKGLLGGHANGMLANLGGLLVVLITLGLGLRGVLRALGLWP